MCKQQPFQPQIQVSRTVIRKSTVDPAVVEEILASAAQASHEAPNRALKRRVRQRLHKKLGSMLPCEEFGQAMERFKVMEESGASPTSPQTELNQLPATTGPQAFIAVPFLMPMMTMVAPVSQASNQMMQAPVRQQISLDALEVGHQKQTSQDIDSSDTASQSTMDDDVDSISELCTEWARAATLGSSGLPVERTFIQFDTRMHVRHKRSRSV